MCSNFQKKITEPLRLTARPPPLPPALKGFLGRDKTYINSLDVA